jgi:15-cis-phytoene desaturase
MGQPTKGLKEVRPEIVAATAAHVPRDPPGVKGNSAIAFGGGEVLSDAGRECLREQDAVQLEEAGSSSGEAPSEERDLAAV